ncbi:hypothetical protein PSN45_004540 [Yamadazyma tenuis]|uniref:Dopa 4,5-dioxygenase n=1 Tax=Candida tenuis (strain ATCC 10573 / BCRC 21748 / CBS 615 / JCM 9827 / NBRC 10315 / NRRL Y-1498 / VKM Y-70) TaxID=590646 RepID=G3B5C2_CANTC|nr:uncharacterized protein CANTEDRAFT_105930 [Yamadazyma tenuis ATCC 10573]EGV63184.1 hypothetical protein CANTEDRAFT_105930 [Yamadazyma tenuis ATCC 10573]WEJ96994.1 hypothetical protein PSN45_004540 [Yamadazyma tenuis]
MDYLTKLNPEDPSSATKSTLGLSYEYPIKYYDFHVYYFAHNKKSLSESNFLRDKFLAEFTKEGKDGSVIVKKLPNDQIIGPHPTQFWEVDVCRPEIFIRVLSWFQLNHGSLSVLIHPQSGDDLLDHTNRALWLGDKLPLFTDVFDPFPSGIAEYGVKGGRRLTPEEFES